MRIITKEEFVLKSFKYIKEIKDKTFIYPTDTIYGIGCDATNNELVKQVRTLKKTNTPFSIIPPSIEWIFENCEIEPRATEWLTKLPGPYTLILRLKKKNSLAPEVNNNMKTIGIRIPDHWFTKVVQMLEKPIITTSANKKGQNFMTSVEDLDKDLKNSINYLIDEGEIKGSPSTIVKFEKELQIFERQK